MFIVRGDCIGSHGQGNKHFKLKYALPPNAGTVVLSPGGAHSNHLHALAIACAARQQVVHGFVRGLDHVNTPTIEFLRSAGMQLHHLNRVDYREERERCWGGLAARAGVEGQDYRLLPEGGSSPEAIRGVREWARTVMEKLCPTRNNPVALYIAGGTGATAAGFICEANEFCDVEVMPAGLFGNWLHAAISQAINDQAVVPAGSWRVSQSPDPASANHSGAATASARRFGRMTDVLERFISDFDREYCIRLDPVYTCRLAFLLSQRLPALTGGADITRRSVLVHTGGLQQPARPARSHIQTWISSATLA